MLWGHGDTCRCLVLGWGQWWGWWKVYQVECIFGRRGDGGNTRYIYNVGEGVTVTSTDGTWTLKGTTGTTAKVDDTWTSKATDSSTFAAPEREALE